MSNINSARKATKAVFLVCGLGMSAWAPMVPYAKERLGLNDSNLGLLLLLLGGGAITMMPISGMIAHRYGSRIVMLVAGIVLATALPLLAVLDSVVPMAIALFVFGAGIGTIDVAMNIHGVEVQNRSDKAIMSSLHGLFSVGGLFGSLGLGFLIKAGLDHFSAALAIAVLLVIIVSVSFQFLLSPAEEKQQVVAKEETQKSKISWLHSSVLFLGIMCFIVFLSEGAMLDWSAVFLRENRGVDEALTGVGYAAFSIAMATMRLVGDKIVAKLSSGVVVIGGSLIAASGLFLAVLTPWLATSIIGFILLGLGAANIVPVFFSEGGKLKDVPASVAIPAMTTIGYAGQLAGPAMLGFIAHSFTLPVAIGFCGILMLIVAISFRSKR
ncbi:MAG: MFS transporter [Flavitalea sp.]